MKVVLQDIAPPIASLSKEYKKILLMNGLQFYPHDDCQDAYHEIALHTLSKTNIKKSSWNIISKKNNALILEHITRSRNIICTTSDALTSLHHCMYTLNAYSEIIPITSSIRANIIREIYTAASHGNYVSGISLKNMESKLSNTTYTHNGIFIALVINEYVLLPKASSTIDKIKKTKKSLKIFSKELLPACTWFARKIGIHASDDFCITSDQLRSMTDSELASHIHHFTVFAEMDDLDRTRVTR